jgi:HAD superfamily hydrolase (TIGR01509 family)
MIKAVIFDMDGVLIEAKEWHYEALNRALRLFGYEINRYEHLTTYDGLPTRKKLEILSLEASLPTQLHDFINEMKQNYTMEIVHAQCKPRFIHEYALSKLKTMGYRLAVASNSIRNTVEVMMSKAHLAPYLDKMFSNEDVKHPKPSPEIYTKAIAQFGLTPSECLVVEDNENGIRAAKSAGAHVLTVSTTDEVNIDNILTKIRQIDGKEGA